MALGELFLSAFIQVLFNKLASRELLSFSRARGTRRELEKWSEMLFAIQAVLEDAEEKQLTDKAVKNWLDNLRDLAYDVEDILDEFAVEAIRSRLRAGYQTSRNKVLKLIPTCFARYSLSSASFYLTIGSRMKNITQRLNDISRQRIELGLERISGSTSRNAWQRPPSTSVPTETRVFGRNEDKEKILELLLRDEPSDANLNVVPIVGMGGIGKTTLAQLLYNDSSVGQFDSKAWVCVSEEFDILRITKAILESITSAACNLKDFNQIQVKLREALAGKKFLIVLDDVWNKNYGEWNRLRLPFLAGAPGSKIIVTTRDSNVALMMEAVKCHYLEHMSNDDCWSVFAQHAFENKDIGAQPNLEKIGREIVKKCKGLPLAARTLGGLLRCKQREDEWENVLNSKLWSLSDEESEILPVLRLSYHHLPSHLKRCFAFCSIFPKDYEFEEKELILLWMAEGLIQQPEENKQIEDLGAEYFHDLLSRSLFQGASRDKSKFVMHDLISDLAQWVAGDTCFLLEDKLNRNKLRKISQKVRYSSYTCGQYDDAKKFESFSDAKDLRTFLPFLPPYPGQCYLSSYVPLRLLPKLRRLRTLSFSGYNISELPDSVGELIHLRYLNLCHTNIRSLPESTSSLCSLQTLLLRDCLHLKKLPKGTGNLINLRHLDITHGELIEGMPAGIKKLTNLQTLSDFVVARDTGCSLRELMDLKFLKETLSISRLENVADPQDARDANLRNKKNLDVLFLGWSSRFNDLRDEKVETDVLDMLQPCTNIKELTIKCYGGTKFPIWLGDPSLSHLVLLRLENCEKCTSLPPLGLLPSLKDLSIVGMSGVKTVGAEFYGEGCSKPFPSLETLHFQAMSEWEDWVHYGVDCEEFPCLQELWIDKCPKLEGTLPRCLLSLQKLVILECKQLVVSCPNLPMLCQLQIKECKEVVNIGPVTFRLLNSAVFSTISTLKCLQGLKNVQELKIFGCEGLTYLWQHNAGLYQWLTSLRRLFIEGCPHLLSLVADEVEEQPQPGWGCALEHLELRHCESLVRLPQCLQFLMSLKEIAIEGCPRLISFPDTGLAPMVRVIRIKSCSALAAVPSEAIYHSVYLESLYIEGCHSLISFGRSQLPPSLKRLEIGSCNNLQFLLYDGESSSSSMMHEEGNRPCVLEYLHVYNCSSLVSLLSGGDLPFGLKHLQIKNCSELASLGSLSTELEHLSIEDCPKLESIASWFQDDMSLESINICNCESLTSLPGGLQNLSRLHEISIWDCPGLVAFSGGLPTANLREVYISWCEELTALPHGLRNVTSLQELWICDCPNIVSFPEEGFPTNITVLTLINLNVCNSLFEWGLHRLNFLKDLYIEGGCQDVVSFPRDETRMTMPASLTRLSIKKFPNLMYLSDRGFENLTSLECLSISYCSKLESFPKKGLPSSLLQLYIYGCPLLKQRSEKDKGREWFKIAHIPCVRIDGRFINDPPAIRETHREAYPPPISFQEGFGESWS